MARITHHAVIARQWRSHNEAIHLQIVIARFGDSQIEAIQKSKQNCHPVILSGTKCSEVSKSLDSKLQENAML